MQVVTTVGNSAKGVKMMLGRSIEEKIVIVPFSNYESLLQQIEDLKDVQEHLMAMEDYRKGKGRSFRGFVSEYEKEFDLQD